MEDECGKCGEKTRLAHPPKYSPEDKFAQYRRKAKYDGKKYGEKHGEWIGG